MNETIQTTCLSCGNENTEGSVFCSRCGQRLSGESRNIISLKWIFISMIVLLILQVTALATAFLIFRTIAGVDSLLENLTLIAFIVIPLSVFTGSFIFKYIFTGCSAVDLAAGMVLFLLLSNAANIFVIGTFSAQGLFLIPVIALVAYAGGFAAKKIREQRRPAG